MGGTRRGQKTALEWRGTSLGWEGPPARGEGDPQGTEEPPGGGGGRPLPRSAGRSPGALRAGQSFSGKECLARRGRPRPGPAWFARLSGPLAPPPGLASDRGAPRSGGARRPSPITQRLVRLVPDSWRRAPLQEKKKREREKGKSNRGS